MLGEASRLSSPTINSVTVHHEKVHCCLYMAFHLLGCTDKSLLNLSDCHSYIFSSSSCCLQTNAQTQGFVALNAALHYICHFQSLFLMEFRWLLISLPYAVSILSALSNEITCPVSILLQTPATADVCVSATRAVFQLLDPCGVFGREAEKI